MRGSRIYHSYIRFIEATHIEKLNRDSYDEKLFHFIWMRYTVLITM